MDSITFLLSYLFPQLTKNMYVILMALLYLKKYMACGIIPLHALHGYAHSTVFENKISEHFGSNYYIYKQVYRKGKPFTIINIVCFNKFSSYNKTSHMHHLKKNTMHMLFYSIVQYQKIEKLVRDDNILLQILT